MQYILLTVTDKKGFITGVDWLVNNKEPKEPFIFQYQGEVIRQHIFREEEGGIFYSLISLYDPEIIKPLNVFDKERKERLNKEK
nr:MAG TPA: hypothetical protein [Herelleviridae sp.]